MVGVRRRPLRRSDHLPGDFMRPGSRAFADSNPSTVRPWDAPALPKRGRSTRGMSGRVCTLPRPAGAPWVDIGREDTGTEDRVMTSVRVAEFVGVSTEHRRGVMEPVGPYEFFTDNDVHVYLHDADLIGLVWQPSGKFRFYFIYPAEWTPREALDTPVVELTFSEVEVSRWETDMGVLQDMEHRGQVSDFAWDGADGFDLSTFSLRLSFSAARMEARVLEAPPDALS